MLCGTPIAAMRQGAVEEIIEEGVSGFSATGSDAFQQLIPRCFQLSRERIRQNAQKRFSAERMASDYASLYQQVGTRKTP